jgi:hypothetical protein
MNTRLLSAIAFALTLSAPAYATPKPTPTPTPAATHSDASAEAAAQAAALAAAIAAQEQSTEVDVSTDASAEAIQAQEQANRQRATQDMSYTDASMYFTPPSVIPPECGIAGNAGGSSNADSAFLGLAVTSGKCYDLKVAALWLQMGEYGMGCEILADVSRKALKRRGITRLDCNTIAARIYARQIVPAPERGDYATREELRRAFEAAQSK